MRKVIVHPLIPTIVTLALLATGCVVSETERGPGPGDQKKDSATSPPPSEPVAPPAR